MVTLSVRLSDGGYIMPEIKQPVTAIIVGAGHRSIFYSTYSLLHPKDLKIVGVADPDRDRCLQAQRMFGFSDDRIYASAQELAAVPKFADAIINGTMDQMHVETSVPLLELGYDMILEKPFACNEAEMQVLSDVVNRKHNKVVIGHVLRYTPFYHGIKDRIDSGDIGEILTLQTTESVNYHHQSTGYVRGKWGNTENCNTTMLLAKCCHDIDIMMWLMPSDPLTVSSFGSCMQYKPENAPENAGERCLVDCPLVDTCPYSAKKIYIDKPQRWESYVWADLGNAGNPTKEERVRLLTNDTQYGKCIYKCDNNVVDHQTVTVNFANGSIGTHNMIGGTAMPRRRIHVTGTRGEIFGDFEDEMFTVLKINPDSDTGYDREIVRLSEEETKLGHGGGDLKLVEDFIDFVRTGKCSIACTSLDDSIAGHLTVFLADKSRDENGMPQCINLSDYIK